ncbi:MAG: DUF3795 domain-containing protein [Promethearchaeota archaeon]
MKQVISKCGNMCSRCPWGVWIRKNQSDDEWTSYVADVKRYVGYTPTKNPCHGCQTPNENLSKDVGVHNFLRGCSARRCAFYNEIRNCAYCSRYPCDKIEVLNRGKSRAHAEKRIGEPIPDDKYESYVRIFEGKKTLDEIREGLDPEEIHEVMTLKMKQPKIVAFPDVERKLMKYKALHETLIVILNSKLDLSDIDTVAGQEMLKERQALLLRLLWIVALYGKKDGDALYVDALSISEHKKGTSGFPTHEDVWFRWFETLKKDGIQGELVLATEDKTQLITPTGWLRDRLPGTNDPAYHVKLSFDEKLGGPISLKLLQSYAHSLIERYDNKGFGRFKKADMRFLEDKG